MTAVQESKAIELYQTGLGTPAIAKILGLKAPGPVVAIIKKRGMIIHNRRNPVLRGKGNGKDHRRLANHLRGRMRKALKRFTKCGRTYEIIGCSPAQIKLHLESQWSPEMNWENYGTYWQVDHIIPCARFDLSKPEEQRRCFHYTNLQPLTAKDNHAKGARYCG
jgi:hypothetical protein